MKTNIDELTCFNPKNLAEALEFRKAHPKALPLAGGTDLMVQMETGRLPSQKMINLSNIKELKGRAVKKDSLTFGALHSYLEIKRDSIVQKEFPMLVEAARLTGAVAIQSRGTLGGNIVNASPAADTPPALLAYNAEIELVGSKGSRWLPYRKFHKDYKKMDLAPDEFLSKIRLNRNHQFRHHFYHKVGTRAFQSISKVCFAMGITVKKNIIEKFALGMGSVSATPLYCRLVEDTVLGRTLNEELISDALCALASEIDPIKDIRSTSDYRLRVSMNLLEHYLRQVMK